MILIMKGVATKCGPSGKVQKDPPTLGNGKSKGGRESYWPSPNHIDNYCTFLKASISVVHHLSYFFPPIRVIQFLFGTEV